MAIETERFHVRNGNDPNPGNVTEEKESELEDFVEYSKMVLGVLGYKIFVPLVKNETVVSDEKEDLQLFLSRKSKKSNTRIEAQCKRTNEGFVVLKGSMIDVIDSKSIPKTIKEIRDKCKAENEIVDGRITKNYLFGSPSYAAAFVLGMNTNGRTDWKTEDGITLKDFEEADTVIE